MSRLIVVAHPPLATGFRLAGVEVVPAEDVEDVKAAIEEWLEMEEDVLVALDQRFEEQLPAAFLRRMRAARNLLYVFIPSGGATTPETSRQHRIARMLRQAVGFSITFREEEIESE